jgi:hypothetical protein
VTPLKLPAVPVLDITIVVDPERQSRTTIA